MDRKPPEAKPTRRLANVTTPYRAGYAAAPIRPPSRSNRPLQALLLLAILSLPAWVRLFAPAKATPTVTPSPHYVLFSPAAAPPSPPPQAASTVAAEQTPIIPSVVVRTPNPYDDPFPKPSPWLSADGVPLTRAPDGAIIKKNKRYYLAGPRAWRVVSDNGQPTLTNVGPEQAPPPAPTPPPAEVTPSPAAVPSVSADHVPLTVAPDGAIVKRGNRYYPAGAHGWRVVTADGRTLYTNVDPVAGKSSL